MTRNQPRMRLGSLRRTPSRLGLESLEERYVLSTFFVDATADAPDSAPGDGICAADVQANLNACTLRAAIMEANALPGNDEIHLNAGIYAITLAGPDEDAAAAGDLDITDSLTVHGAGQSSTVIDGGGLDRVLHVLRRGGEEGPSVVTLAINNLSILNGLVTGSTPRAARGGGILAEGDVTLHRVTVTLNTAIGAAGRSGASATGGFGGGIYVDAGTLTLFESIVAENQAEGGVGTDMAGAPGHGGGIYNDFGNVLVSASLLRNNLAIGGHGTASECTYATGGEALAGGIMNAGGTLHVLNSSLSGNQAVGGNGLDGADCGAIGGTARGAAVFVDAGRANIVQTTLSDNLAAGGDTLTGAEGFTSAGNAYGGAILTINGAQLAITQSTIARNIARSQPAQFGGRTQGGGLWTDSGQSYLENTTVSNNQAAEGGGIYKAGAPANIQLLNATVYQNTADTGGGTFSQSPGISLANTVLARNTALQGPDCSGALDSQGHNLIESLTDCSILTSDSDITGIDPQLAPLGFYGGPTPTHLPNPGSPLINQIDPGNAPGVDQRGVNRPQGPLSDIGSVELSADADLSITQTDAPDPVAAGDELLYELTVSNGGPSDAQDVVVVDSLPPELSSGTFCIGANCDPASGSPWTGSVELGNLIAGSTQIVRIRSTVRPDTANDSIITNIASVSSNTNDPDQPNSATETTSVVRESDLAISKSDSADPVATGTSYSYSIQVVNNGPSDASGVTVTDQLPPGVSFNPAGSSTNCSHEGQTVTCQVGKVPAGSQVPLSIAVSVSPAGAEGGTVTNLASVSGNEFDRNPSNNSDSETTTIEQRQADLAITKQDSPDPVPAGAEITYTLTIVNNGPSDASDVVVTDTLPAGSTFSSSSPGGPVCREANGVVTCTIPRLANGASTVVTIKILASCGAVTTNTASVEAAEQDPDLSNNVAIEQTVVEGGSHDIEVELFTAGGEGGPGQLRIDYEIKQGAPGAFEFVFFSSNDPFFDSSDVQRGPAFAVTNPSDLTVGQHTIRIDGTPYASFLTDLDVPFFLAVARSSTDNGTCGSDSDTSNNDRSFIGTFHSSQGTGPLVVRGRHDLDRYADNPDDALRFGRVGGSFGSEVEVTGTFGTTRAPLQRVSELRVLTLGGDDRVNGDCANLPRLVARGGPGNDFLTATQAHSILNGDAGDDQLQGCSGNDQLLGGSGRDTGDFSRAGKAVQVNLDNGSATGDGSDPLDSIEDIIGSSFSDLIIGDSGVNRLFGMDGNDTVRGGRGADLIDGGTGDDLLIGDNGDPNKGEPDEIHGGSGHDYIFGDGGNDLLHGGSGNDTLCGQNGDDTEFGDAGNDRVVGGFGNDSLQGGDGTDLLEGCEGQDKLFGDAGNDLLVGGADRDSMDGGDGADTILGNRMIDSINTGKTKRRRRGSDVILPG